MTTHEINLGKGLSSKQADDSLGLMIKRIRSNSEQKHTGFVFLDNETGTPISAHVANKNCYVFERDKLRGYGVLWLGFISERNAAIITSELRMLGLKASDKVPYGITNLGGTRFEDGVVVTNPAVKGDSLTCATFVLCILEQFGFNIIDRDSWTITDEDIQWQETMVELLKPFLQPEFYELQKENIGKVVRMRPEQIVGACGVYDFSPINYSQACEAAETVLEELDKL